MEALGGKRIREYFEDQYNHCVVVDYEIDVNQALEEHSEFEPFVLQDTREKTE